MNKRTISLRKSISTYTLSVIVFCCLLSANSYAQNAFWKHVYPELPGETLNDAYFIDDNNGIIVGEGGAVIRTSDGGSNWNLLNYATFNTLNRVSFGDSATGYIIGEYGTVLKSTDGGYRWKKMTFSDSVSLLSVHFVNKDTGFVTADSFIYKTTNGGNSWSRQVVKSGQYTVKKVSHIQFFGVDTGYALYEMFKPNPQTTIPATVMVTYNGGSTWTDRPSQNQNFYSFSLYDKNTGWAISDSNGYDNYCKTTDGGTTWTKQYTTKNGQGLARQLYVTDPNNVYVLNNGQGGSSPMYYTNNGGNSWSMKYTATDWTTSVVFLTDEIGFVTDIWGGIFKTTNGATNWSVVSSDTSNLAGQLRKMEFGDSLYKWAGGAKRIARTRDGGTTWTTSASLPYSQLLERMSFPDTTHGWLSTDGGYIFRSTDGGSTWIVSSSNLKAMDVKFYDSSLGMVARKEGKIDITHNGGSSWTTYNFNTTNDVTRVSCVDSLNWYAIISTSLYRTNDAGNSWSFVKNNLTSVYDFENFDTSLSYISRSGSIYKVYNNGSNWGTSQLPYTYYVSVPEISFSDSMRGAVTNSTWWGNSYKFPRIYMTKDGMNNWQQLAINSNSKALDIHFTDTNDIWVCTNYGSIYHYDPDNASDSTLTPFVNADGIVACKNSTAEVVITNYHTYGSADTIKAILKQGTTVLQTITVTNDTISFTTPSTLGSYILNIIVTNPMHPEGLKTTVSVQIANSSTPNFNYSLNVSKPHCSLDTVLVSFTYGSALGKGFSYELHKLENNKDTIISVNQKVTGTSGTDTFSVYYKVYLGTGICQPFPFYYTDTTTVNIVAPQKVTATLTTTKTGNFACMGDSLSLVVNANNIGTAGQYYEFHRISATNPDSLVTNNTTDRLYIDPLTDTAYYFCRVFPGTNSCAIQDTVHTDTILVYAKPIINSVTASITASKHTICTGDTVLFSAVTIPPGQHSRYSFYIKNNSGLSQVQTGASEDYSSTAINNHDSVFCFIHTDTLGCFADATVVTDTVVITVNTAPAQLTITQLNKDTLSAPTITGGIYSWYYNGKLIPNANANVLAPDSTGTYTVTVTVNGCTSTISSGVYFEKKVGVSIIIDGSDHKIVIAPNPTTGIVHIHMDDHPAEVSVNSINGQEVLRTRADTADFTMNISNYTKGIYLIRITNVHGTFTKKLILQ